jgi:hypothetical protein
MCCQGFANKDNKGSKRQLRIRVSLRKRKMKLEFPGSKRVKQGPSDGSVLVAALHTLLTVFLFLFAGAGLPSFFHWSRFLAMRVFIFFFAVFALLLAAVDAREDRVARLKRQLLTRQSPFNGPTTVTTTRTAETYVFLSQSIRSADRSVDSQVRSSRLARSPLHPLPVLMARTSYAKSASAPPNSSSRQVQVLAPPQWAPAAL